MAFVFDSLLKGLGKRAAGKEAKRAGEEQATGQFKSDQAGFANKEAGRQGALSNAEALLSGLYGGKYAFNPNALAQMKAPRQDTSFKHAVVDPSKGAMWGAAGDMVGDVGNLGMAALSGGMLKGQSAAEPTSLRMPKKLFEDQSGGY